MTPLEHLPQPDECPAHIEWDRLSPTAQHGFMTRLTQLGRIDITEDDALFNGRILAGAKKAS